VFTQSLKVGILGYHFSGSSDTNHDSLLSNTIYTGPPRLRYLFQVVQTQTMAAYCRIYLHWTTMFEIFFQVVQTQTTAAYCWILPTLDHHVSDIFSGSSGTNHNRLLYWNSTETAPSLVSLAHRRKVNIDRLGQSERRTLFRSITLE
jgi:hypothetical protein